MAETCPRCLKVLPNRWSRETEGGIYTHVCGAKLRPLLDRRRARVIGVIVAVGTPLLLAFLGYHDRRHALAGVFIGSTIGFIVAIYAARPVLVPGSSVKGET